MHQRLVVGGALSQAYFSGDSKRFTQAIEPIRFDSCAEVAVAVLLERYMPGWECQPGKTFQIPIGTKRIDFRFQAGKLDCFLEYHPIKLQHEFDDKRAWYCWCEALRGCDKHTREALRFAIGSEFAAEYAKKRRDLLDAAGLTASKLIVCFNPLDVFKLVLRPFTECKRLDKAMIDEFYRVVKACG